MTGAPRPGSPSRRPIPTHLLRAWLRYACDEPPSVSRLDKWLFCARFYRTRSLAQAAAAAGKVRLNGVRQEKPGHVVKPGDVLTLGKSAQVMAVKILALAERRGSATEARKLYEILE